MPVTSDSNYHPATSWVPTAPSFPAHRMMPGTPGTPGPPGLVSASSIYPNPTTPSTNSDSSTVPRQNLPAIALNPVGPHMSSPYPSIPAMAAPQGLWLQPPPMSGVPRPPFLPYAAAFPVRFPFATHGVPPPAVPLPDSQPPGVTPVGAAGTTSVPSTASSHHQLSGTSGLQTEVISGHTGILTTVLLLHCKG